MSNKLRHIALVLIVSASHAGVALGDPVTGNSLAHAFDRAATNRLNVRLIDIEIAMAQHRVDQANSRFRPTLDIVSNIEKVHDYDAFSGTTASVEIPTLNLESVVDVESSTPRYNSSVDLSANYNLYSGGGDVANLRKSRLELESTVVLRKIEIQSLTQEVAVAYFNLRRACVLSEGASRRLKSARVKRVMAGERLKLGRISDIEYREVVLGHVESESAQNLQVDEFDTAFIDYTESVGVALGEFVTKNDACNFSNNIDADLKYLSSLSDNTLYRHYRELQWDSAKKQIEVARSEIMPKVKVYAKYAFVGRGDDAMSDAITDLHKDKWTVGVQVQYNIFDGSFSDRRIDESIAQAEYQRLQLEILNNNVSQSIRRAEIKKRIAEDKIKLAQARLELERTRTTLLREKLESGTVSTLTINSQIDIEQNALENLQIAELDHALVMLDWLFPASTGEINIKN